MLPIASIAKLLIRLATTTPVANDSIDNIRKLIDTVRKPGAGTQNQLDDLKKAIELQLIINREINNKLTLTSTVLQTVQKSLKVMAVTLAGVGLIAVAALVVALLK